MVNVPSQPEIITVNSEALQTQIRDLLPSQNGFGSELQASNVIFPIIDLTRSAEGSNLALDLQTAIAFGSQTALAINNTTTTIANSPGFYRLIGVASHGGDASRVKIIMSDGVTNKNVWQSRNRTTTAISIQVDLIFWLAAGQSLSIQSETALTNFDGSIRQVGNSQGQLVNPSGFPL